MCLRCTYPATKASRNFVVPQNPVFDGMADNPKKQKAVVSPADPSKKHTGCGQSKNGTVPRLIGYPASPVLTSPGAHDQSDQARGMPKFLIFECKLNTNYYLHIRHSKDEIFLSLLHRHFFIPKGRG